MLAFGWLEAGKKMAGGLAIRLRACFLLLINLLASKGTDSKSF